MSKNNNKKDNSIKDAKEFFQLLVTDSKSAIAFAKNVEFHNIDLDYVDELINKSSHPNSDKNNFRELINIIVESEFRTVFKYYVFRLLEENDNESLQIRKENVIKTLRTINSGLMQVHEDDDMYWFFMSMSSTLERELRYIEKLNEASKMQGAAKITNILPEKILWRDTQQDLVALYDELIKLGMIVPVKNKDQLLKKHFQILDENTEEAKELGELKHTRKQLNEGNARPTEKMEAILKKLNDSKVDDK